MLTRVIIVRHGETEWSRTGRHTGRTEAALSGQGEQNALGLAPRMATLAPDAVLTSPRLRAIRTCELAGLGARAHADTDLAEWDYGDYEGLRTAEILAVRPDWNLFRDGCPGGESPAQVSGRADRVLARIRPLGGTVALFTHGHFGRVLAARWVGLAAGDGERLVLDTASVSILSYEHGNPAAPAITLWNERRGGIPG